MVTAFLHLEQRDTNSSSKPKHFLEQPVVTCFCVKALTTRSALLHCCLLPYLSRVLLFKEHLSPPFGFFFLHLYNHWIMKTMHLRHFLCQLKSIENTLSFKWGQEHTQLVFISLFIFLPLCKSRELNCTS